MNEFVGTAPFLKIALGFDMETAFHIAQTSLFLKANLFPHIGGPNKQFGIHLQLPWASKVGQISSQPDVIMNKSTSSFRK